MNTDLISMLGNLGRSLLPVDSLIAGFAYLTGIIFFFTALSKFKKMADSRSGSQEKIVVPIAYVLGGVAFIYLPTALQVLSYSTFGTGNVLQYVSYNPYDVYSSMRILVQTAGLIWFVRGCVLLVSASDAGQQHGPKGFAFLCAGILAMNLEYTVAFVNWIVAHIESMTLTIKKQQGY